MQLLDDTDIPKERRAAVFEASVGVVNGAAVSIALFTAAAYIARHPEFLFGSPALARVEVISLIALGFGSIMLNAAVFRDRMSKIKLGGFWKLVSNLFLAVTLMPLLFALLLSSLQALREI